MRHPLMQGITLETVIDESIQFMRLMGNPTIFEEKVEELEVVNYRASLPCDFYKEIGVRPISEHDAGRAFTSSSDSFHMSNKGVERDSYGTYKIQNSVIHTNLKEGKIELAYSAISTDDEGYPLIPENTEFERALEAYIKMNYFTILFDLNKISQNVYHQAKQDYAWAAGAAQSEFNRMSLDEAESFYNSWRTLLVRTDEHSRGFKTNNRRENLKYN